MPHFVRLDSEEGEYLLKKSQEQGLCLNNLNRTIKRQETEFTCSISSISAVSNAWSLSRTNTALSQDTLPFSEHMFTERLYSMKPSVSKTGIHLQDMADLIVELFPGQVSIVKKTFADPRTIDEFREDIATTCATHTCQKVMIINYFMQTICQDWLAFGHFSPVSAFERESDSILLADTYLPSYWTNVELMFHAIDTIDSDSNEKRGYLLLNWIEELP